MSRTRADAITFLTRRWHEQADKFPLMRDDVPLAKYIAANIWHAMHNRAPDQKPCDVGLFSDDAKQIDLCDLIARSS